MFEILTNRLNQVFNQLRRRGKLSEADVDSAMREVRLALLEADVHYSVVKDFIDQVRKRSIGQEVSRALADARACGTRSQWARACCSSASPRRC